MEISRCKEGVTLAKYTKRFGIRVTEIVAVSGRSRSTVDDWWRRKDYLMIDMAINAILFEMSVSTKAKNAAVRRHLGLK